MSTAPVASATSFSAHSFVILFLLWRMNIAALIMCLLMTLLLRMWLHLRLRLGLGLRPWLHLRLRLGLGLRPWLHLRLRLGLGLRPWLHLRLRLGLWLRPWLHLRLRLGLWLRPWLHLRLRLGLRPWLLVVEDLRSRIWRRPVHFLMRLLTAVRPVPELFLRPVLYILRLRYRLRSCILRSNRMVEVRLLRIAAEERMLIQVRRLLCFQVARWSGVPVLGVLL